MIKSQSHTPPAVKPEGAAFEKELPALRGAIFDLDGTLFDSMGVWREVDVRFLRRRGIDLPSDYTDAVKTMHFFEAANYTIARFRLDETPQEIVDEWTEMTRELYAKEVCLKAGAKDFLFTLARRGLKLGISTSSVPELFLPVLARTGIRDLFSAITVTAEIGRGKEFPDIYLKTAERLALTPSECAVFEDVPLGICSAKAGGFFTVAVYDASSAAEETMLRATADDYFTAFPHLPLCSQ